jgi:hypothetical protein
VDIPRETVPPGEYEIDPATEVILTGSDLTMGMIVLIAPSKLRNHSDGKLYANEPYRIETRAHWCRVTKLERGSDPGNFQITGLYADGKEHRRFYGKRYTWIVKIASIPK